MPDTEVKVLEFDSEDEAIAARFMLEIYEGAGEDEVDAAFEIFRRQRVTATMIDMWDTGLFQIRYLADRNDLGYKLTEFGEAVAQRIENGEDADEVAAQIASVAKAVNQQQ